MRIIPSPHSLKRSVNLPRRSFHKLSLVLAVALATQSAIAEVITIGANDSYRDDIIASDETLGIDNQGTIENDQIVLKGGSFKNSGTIKTGTLDLFTSGAPVLDGVITADEFIYRGLWKGESVQSRAVNAILTTNKLSIIGTKTARSGLEFYSSASLENVGEIYVESNGGKTGLYLSQKGSEGIRYDHTVRLNSVAFNEDARIEVSTGTDTPDAYFYVKEVVSDSRIIGSNGSKSKLQITNGSGRRAVFEVGRINVETGFLNLQTLGVVSKDSELDPNSKDREGTFILHEVNLAEKTHLRAAVWDDLAKGKPATPPIRIEGDITFNLAPKAGVDFGGWNTAGNKDWSPDLITVAADRITINVFDSDGDNFVYLSENGLKTEPGSIRVIADPANNTGNAAADLEKLVGVVQTNYKDDQRNNHLECLPGVQLEQAASDIYDGAVGVVDEGIIDPETGDCIGCGVTDMRTIDNPNINGIAEMTALGLHIWRNEIDDMHRRLGELRDSSAQANGFWTRIYNGKATFGGQNIENKYSAFQFGYDHQVSPGLWMGGALSYTYGDNTFEHGDGDSNLLAFTGYASRLFDNGMYLDFTGKIGRMKNSFDISLPDIRSSGDYHTNAVSVSAEAGWRFYPIDNVFIEPQVEIWYGHVFDADYTTSTNVNVEQASTDSLVGRAGFRLGVKCPNNRGSAFIKASVLHDWEGEADFRFSKGTEVSRTITEDLGGTWYEYGVGADFNATKQLHFWAELERGEGGEVDTDYRATIGMRYAW